MIDLLYKCEQQDCGESALYGFKEDNIKHFCEKHKTEGIILKFFKMSTRRLVFQKWYFKKSGK